MDGVLLPENLIATNITEAWVIRQLELHGIRDVGEVFYAGLAPNGSLYISKRTPPRKEMPGEHGIE
jgi:uncharacterized membrane protein YcaP (DUF421 family)